MTHDKERREDYPNIMSEVNVLKNEVNHINKMVNENVIDAMKSLKLHNAKLMHVQGYEDRFNDKLDAFDIKMDRLQSSVDNITSKFYLIINGDGNGNVGLKTRIDRIEQFTTKQFKDHVIQDRWCFGSILTMLLFICSVVIKMAIQ